MNDGGDNQRILDAIHDHDNRLVAVETEMHGLHKEVGEMKEHIKDNSGVSRAILEKMHAVAIQITSIESGNSAMRWLFATAIGVFGLILSYAVFFKV